jgi:hypothetical protein
MGLVLFFNTDTKSKLNIAVIYEASFVPLTKLIPDERI